MTLAIVHNRVDGLVVAFRVTMSEAAKAELVRAGRVAKDHGRSIARVAGLEWECKSGAASHVFLLRREEHVRARIDLRAPGSVLLPREVTTYAKKNGALVAHVDIETTHEAGWTLELVFYASHLAEHNFDRVLSEARAIGEAFGTVHESRLRRIDLAADVADWKIRDCDRRALVKRSRVKLRTDPARPTNGQLRDVIEERDSVALATGHYRAQMTGLTLGKGHFVARIYDKQEELRCMSPHKDAAERARWSSGGWDGAAPVTRVEFQIRGEAIRELGMQNLDQAHDPETGEVFALSEYLPRVWATSLRWVRLVRRERTRGGRRKPLTRCGNDPRWSILSRTSWGHASPIRRLRERGGASGAQTLGATLSLCAKRGKLENELPEEPESYRDKPIEHLRSILAVLGQWGIDAMACELIDRHQSAEAATVHVAVLWNAARARFARVKEKERQSQSWQTIKNEKASTESPSLELSLENQQKRFPW